MFNDADIEMAGLQAEANRNAKLRKRGICTHGWVQSGVDASGKPMSGTCAKCHDCGRIFSSYDALEYSREMAREEGIVV